MKSPDLYDILIVGGGIAGMVAACRATELGLKTLLLEKGDKVDYPCNTRFAGGTYHLSLRDLMAPTQSLIETMVKSSDGFISEQHAQSLAQGAPRLIEWLQAAGMSFIKVSEAEHHRWAMTPQGRTRPGLAWRGLAGDVLLQTLGDTFKRQGGTMVYGARARSLVMIDRVCKGVQADAIQSSGQLQEKIFHSKNVFIADGGFQSNLELLGRYISPKPDQLLQRGGATGCGDGLQMALNVGAAVSGMDAFYGHTLSKDALQIPSLWPYPYLDSLVTAGVVINSKGERFVDEGRGGVFVANHIARLTEPLSTCVVFDDSIWNLEGRNGLIPPNPHVPKEGGTLHQASTLVELALACQLPVQSFQTTIEQYNQQVKNDAWQGSVSPSRGTSKYRPKPIIKAPFYAIPICVGITYTMGGIKVNIHSQVLRNDLSVIEGLFALGASSGGFEGGPQVAYVGGLVKGGVNALNAVEFVHAKVNV
jgi:fumarate reductase flavoprotein subunit